MPENFNKILLADAHPCSRIGLYQVLTDAGFYISSETGCLSELDTLLQIGQPRILLLSSNLLPSSYIPFLATLNQRYPQTAIVLLLDDYTDSLLQQLVKSGINSMILKTESSRVIVQIIQVAIVGGVAFSPELFSRIMTLPHSAQTNETQDINLTMQEQQLLQLLCADNSNSKIALALNLSHKTIEKRLTALYVKLNVKTRTGAAIWYIRYKNRVIPP